MVVKLRDGQLGGREHGGLQWDHHRETGDTNGRGKSSVADLPRAKLNPFAKYTALPTPTLNSHTFEQIIEFNNLFRQTISKNFIFLLLTVYMWDCFPEF